MAFGNPRWNHTLVLGMNTRLLLVNGSVVEVDNVVVRRGRMAVVEIDGDTHRRGNRYAADHSRDQLLRDAGVHLERVVAEDMSKPNEYKPWCRRSWTAWLPADLYGARWRRLIRQSPHPGRVRSRLCTATPSLPTLLSLDISAGYHPAHALCRAGRNEGLVARRRRPLVAGGRLRRAC